MIDWVIGVMVFFDVNGVDFFDFIFCGVFDWFGGNEM